MQDRIKEHDQDIRLALTQTSAVSPNTTLRKSEDRNAPITYAESQLITAKHPALKGDA